MAEYCPYFSVECIDDMQPHCLALSKTYFETIVYIRIDYRYILRYIWELENALHTNPMMLDKSSLRVGVYAHKLLSNVYGGSEVDIHVYHFSMSSCIL